MLHPVLFDPHRRWWFGALWAALTAIVVAAIWYLARWPILDIVLTVIPLSVVYAFIVLSAIYVCRANPIGQRGPGRTLIVFAGASAIGGLLLACVAQAWIMVLRSAAPELLGNVMVEPRLYAWIFLGGASIYLLSILAHDIVLASENIRRAERREIELVVQARDAELQFLRSQINPHFLFNSLNSISALTAIDASAARDMTIALAQFFRLSLSLGHAKRIALSDELELCKTFVGIEKIRFGERLNVSWQIDEQALDAHVLPMLLQPLIENAVKHGVQSRIEGGQIEVRAQIQGAWLALSVHNTYDAGHTLPAGSGTGLANIRKRCLNVYHERVRFEYGARGDNSFVVELTIPLERKD